MVVRRRTAPGKQSAAAGPIVSIAGTPFFDPSTSLDFEVPSLSIRGAEAYPLRSPEGIPLKLSRQFWDRLVRKGEVYTSEAFRQELLADGITNRALGRKGKEAAISDEDFRFQISEWAYRTLVPISSRADGDGFGLSRSREEADEYTEQLRRRAKSMKKAGAGVGRSLSSWGQWETTCEGWDDEVVEIVVEALRETRKTNGQLSALIGQGDRSRAQSWKGSRIRDLIHDLRVKNCLPIVANNRGYTLADDPSDVNVYLESLKGRIEAIESRAEQSEKAAKLWFPETADELAEAERLASQPRSIDPSPAAAARARAAADAKDRRDEERQSELQLYRELAEARLTDLREQYAVALHREGYQPTALTKEDKAVLAEYRAARRFAKGAAPKRGITYRWSPPPKRSKAPTNS
jgi:hypothetical protein